MKLFTRKYFTTKYVAKSKQNTVYLTVIIMLYEGKSHFCLISICVFAYSILIPVIYESRLKLMYSGISKFVSERFFSSFQDALNSTVYW